MASGETGSMVQDEGGWWVVGDEPHLHPRTSLKTPFPRTTIQVTTNPMPSKACSNRSTSPSRQRQNQRKGLDDVWKVLSQYRASLPGFHNPPSSFAGSRFEDDLREMLQNGESEGFIPWASALVLATKLRLECITIRHPTFEKRYGNQRLEFATGLPWRAVFSTKAEVIHILDATDTDPTQVEDLVLNLREARDSLRPSATKMYDTITSVPLAEGVHAIIELEINGSLLSARFDQEVKHEQDHSNLLNGLAKGMLNKTKRRTSSLKAKLRSLFPRLSSRTDLDDWNYDLVDFPWVAASDSEGNTVVHGDEHGGNFFIGRAEGNEDPTVLPIDFFDAVFWKEGQIQSVGGTDGWRIFSSSLKDEPQVQPMEEQLNAVASFSRLVVGLLQTRHAEMEDKIQSVLEMSLEALNTCLRLEKDSPKHNLPKHNAMFLLAALDWATYWYEHKDQRLSFEGFEAFEKAVIELLHQHATVLSRAFDIQYPVLDGEIEHKISQAQTKDWKSGGSIALIRSDTVSEVASKLEERVPVQQMMHVLHDTEKHAIFDPGNRWYVDARFDWQQRCVESLRSWIGGAHDIHMVHHGEHHGEYWHPYEVAIWLPTSNPDHFDSIRSNVSIHPWMNDWMNVAPHPSLRYALTRELSDQECYEALVELVMDLILEGLQKPDHEKQSTVFQNMMHAAGTGPPHPRLKIANVNFDVDSAFEKPLPTLLMRPIDVQEVEDHLLHLMENNIVSFDPQTPWGLDFLKWARTIELPVEEYAILNSLSPKMSEYDEFPLGLTEFAKWFNDCGLEFEASDVLRRYMKKRCKDWLRRFLGHPKRNPAPTLHRTVFGIRGSSL